MADRELSEGFDQDRPSADPRDDGVRPEGRRGDGVSPTGPERLAEVEAERAVAPAEDLSPPRDLRQK